jgi:hypothetical protein
LANIRASEGGGKKRIQYTKVSDYVNARQKAEKAAENRLKNRQEKKKAQENKAGRKANAKTMNITARGEAISQKIRNTSGITTEAKNKLANEIRKDLTSKFTGRRNKWITNVELNERLKKLQSDPKTRVRVGKQKTFAGNRREENVAKKPKLTLNAAKNEIKKLVAKGKSLNWARRQLSRKYHPNKGGTKENFQTLENAYEALKKNEVVNAKKPNVNMRKQLKLEAAKRRESKNEFQNASNKTFNERNAELGREKTRLVQRVNKNIPGLLGQYRRTWQSNIRQAKNKNALTTIEKLLNEKVKLRSEIQRAKISNADRRGHLRWVMQKRNDVQKRRQELARHVNENSKRKAEANAAAKKKAEANAAAKKKANAERNALKKEIQGSNIGVKNRTRFIRDLNAGKKVANVRKQFNMKKKAPKSKTVMQLAAPAPNKKPVASKAGTKALANASKKKELAGKLRLAAKKSVAQNIKKSNLGNKSKQKLLTELKKKKTGPKRVQNNLKKKMSSGGMRSYRTRKQLNQKFTFATAKNMKPARSESWRFK